MPLGMVSSMASMHLGGKMDVVSMSSISVSSSLQCSISFRIKNDISKKVNNLLVEPGVKYSTHDRGVNTIVKGAIVRK